jgi:2-keto-3-deoxy-L-rhamnonate aldolase RhmA
MFREKLRRREPLLGTFVKTASHQTTELLGLAELDYAVIDAEHAPFDKTMLDRMILGARSVGLPVLVRVPDHDSSFINACLDLGAEGILVPHVCSAAIAAGVVEAAKYGSGKRGFSPSSRAGGYGLTDPASYLREADARTTVWCQIEDAGALDQLDAIIAVGGIDCLFIGRTDLALSLGVEGLSHPRVIEATHYVAAAAGTHGLATGIFLNRTAEIPALLNLGITAFVCGSDQSLLLEQAVRVKKDFVTNCESLKRP